MCIDNFLETVLFMFFNNVKMQKIEDKKNAGEEL